MIDSDNRRLSITNGNHESENTRHLLEVICVTAASILLFFAGLAWAMSIIPLAYLLIERIVRKRGWQELGVKHHGLINDLTRNWHLFLLVIVLMQLATILGSRFLFPSLFDHIYGRLAYIMEGFGQITPWLPFILMLALATFLEEMSFRAFLQERVSWYYNDTSAIVVASLVMALVHISVGDIFVVALDVLTVFIDSIIYGLIYARSRNILLSWIGHFTADIIATLLLLFLV